jgi:redox-sensitive bicupin YhaK (pirin superfamily)
MITLRPANERGHANHGWLDTYHTFSFADYYDPAHMGFRSLRVINDDRVAPGGGFGTHPHRDMEIITYVLDGALEHKDSMGNGSAIRAGDVQYMGAGTGVTHSEFNHSQTEPVHLLQIWILPERKGLKPAYDQVTLSPADTRGKLHRVALPIRQDIALYASALAPGDKVTHTLAPGRHAWLHVARGAVTLNGRALKTGDGAAVSEEKLVDINNASEKSELLLFDLA